MTADGVDDDAASVAHTAPATHDDAVLRETGFKERLDQVGKARSTGVQGPAMLLDTSRITASSCNTAAIGNNELV